MITMKTDSSLPDSAITRADILTAKAKALAEETVGYLKNPEACNLFDSLQAAIKEMRELGGVVALRADGCIERCISSSSEVYVLLEDDAYDLANEGGAEAWADGIAEEITVAELVPFFEKSKDLQDDARYDFWAAVGKRFVEMAKGTAAEGADFPSESDFDGDTVEEQAAAGLAEILDRLSEEEVA